MSFRAAGDPHDHMINVAVDDWERVAFLDGQAGGLAVLPADPAMVRFVLTADPQDLRGKAARPGPRGISVTVWGGVISVQASNGQLPDYGEQIQALMNPRARIAISGRLTPSRGCAVPRRG